MKLAYLKVGAPIALLMTLSGCMDDKYDLDDIDTTTQISINDLTVPVNLKDILIDDVIDLNDENFKEVKDANGRTIYALSREGEINSDDIVVDPIHIKPDDMSRTTITLSKSSALPNLDIVFPIREMQSTFNYSASHVDEAVKSIKSIETTNSVSFHITLGIPTDLDIQKLRLENVKIHFPKGLYQANGKPAKTSINGQAGGSYDPVSGDVLISDFTAVGTHNVEIVLYADIVDTAVNGVKIDSNRNVDFSGYMGVEKQGDVILTPAAGASLKDSFVLSADYNLNPFDVKNFSGEIDYIVDDVKVDPIELNDLPDFLQDKETRIFLANPQIYVGVKNSTADYKTQAATKISLSSHFKNAGTRVETSNPINIGYDLGPDVQYNIVLSPDPANTTPLPEFAENAHKVAFPGFGDILANLGENPDGLPSQIDINLDAPRFYGNAEKFPVKVPNADPKSYTITGFDGSYTVFAPLAFNPKSVIVYNKTDDGWGSEDLDGLDIKTIKLTAHAKTTVPVQVRLTVYPLDQNGNKLGHSNSFTLPPMADEDVMLEVTGDENNAIKGLDGIEYHAVIEQTEVGAGQPLAPDETIQLKDIRIKVSGTYTKEF